MVDFKELNFVVMLTPEDRYRHRHIRLKGQVLHFLIQYETILEGKWIPVVRYDTQHGFAYRDCYDKTGKKRKTPLYTKDYNEALTFAEYDIKSNWRMYKTVFLGGINYGNEEG